MADVCPQLSRALIHLCSAVVRGELLIKSPIQPQIIISLWTHQHRARWSSEGIYRCDVCFCVCQCVLIRARRLNPLSGVYEAAFLSLFSVCVSQ